MRVLISGASQGLGKALAKALTEDGHKVVLLARNRRKLEELAEELNMGAGEELASLLPFDLADLADLEEEFSGMLEERCSRLDALVNNAGAMLRKSFGDVSAGEVKALFETNFFAPALLTRLCLPLMKNSALKHVVNISSMGGFQGSVKFGGLSYYSASKAALGNLSECLAEELKDEGVKVNALALGAAQTPMLEATFPGYEAPLQAEDMATFLKWFTLEGGKYFNGKVLPVALSTP